MNAVPPDPSPRSRGEGAAKRRMRGAILQASPLTRPSATLSPLRGARALIVTIAAILLPVIANACPVCFGDPNSAMTKGTNNGIFFLLGIVGFVQIGLGAMFIAFWRRARALRARRDSLRVINGGFLG
jgi:hypothetical protein